MLKPASRNETIEGEFTVPGKSLGSKHTVSSVWSLGVLRFAFG